MIDQRQLAKLKHESFYNNILKRLYEKLHMSILETRAVAAFPYKKQIEIIIQFISKLYLDSEDYKPITFDVNDIKELDNSDKIDLADTVKINVFHCDDLAEIKASYEVDQTVIKDNEVKKVVFNFYITGIGNLIEECILRRLLYHEFTHCKEDIRRRLTTGISLQIDDIYFTKYRLKYDEIVDFLQKPIATKASEAEFEVCNLLYRLYIDTERNASSNELYAVLLSLRNNGYKIERHNIKDYILNYTEAGQYYVYFRDIISDYSKTVWWIQFARKYFSDKFNEQFKSDEEFKQWFIRFGEKALMTFFNQLCKIGETYLMYEDYEISYSTEVSECSKMITESIRSNLAKYNKTINSDLIEERYTVVYKKIGQQTYRTKRITINKFLLELL